MVDRVKEGVQKELSEEKWKERSSKTVAERIMERYFVEYSFTLCGHMSL